MSKYNERLKAREMRKRGMSVIVIAKEISVTKGTVSKWCADIRLTNEQNLKLQKNKGLSVKTGQRIGAEINKQKKINAIIDAEKWGKEMIGKISKRELMLVSMALYWCEGSKSDSTSSFMFVNSDPEMVKIMNQFLIKILDVPKTDIACRIQINKVHEYRINKVLIFWKKLLQLSDSQVRKPYFVKTSAKKVYENHNEYFGVCRLFVLKSKNLQYKILGVIKAFKQEILSA